MKPADQIKVIALALCTIVVMVAFIAFVSVKTSESVAAHGGGHSTTEEHSAASTEQASSEEHAAPAAEEHAATTEEHKTEAKTEEHAAAKTEEHKTETQKKEPADTKTVAASGGNAEAGSKVFMAKSCTTCHTVSKLAGAVGTLGPKLDGLGKTAATRVSGKSAEEYIKESIENPNAFVVSGFQPIMTPGLKTQMSEQEFKDLVAFLGGL